jgi:GDSL-like Lipase/Acylhydrolase family
MRTLFVLIAVLAAWVSAASACVPMPAAYPPKPDTGIAHRRHVATEGYIQRRLAERQFAVVTIGDSIMGMWPHELLEGLWGAPLLNGGRGGSTTLDWLNWLDAWDWSKQAPDVVHINIGRNDLNYDICPIWIAIKVVEVVKKVRAKWPDARVVWQTLTPAGEYQRLYATEIREVNRLVTAQSSVWGFEVLDAWTPIAARCQGQRICGVYYAGDERVTHLSQVGYEVIYAEAVMP